MSNRSFARGLAILGTFQGGQPQTLTSVSRNTGLSKATARRFLSTLVEVGYLRAGQDKRFRLTTKALDLGFSALMGQGITSALQEPLREIAEICGGAGNLVELDGHRAVVVARQSAPTEQTRFVSLNITVGSRLPVLHSGHGRMLLAQSPEIAHQLLSNPPDEAFSDRGVRDIDRISRAISEAQRLGYCWLQDEFQLGYGSLAVPVEMSDERIFVLGASFTLADHNLEDLKNRLLNPLRCNSMRLSKMLHLQ